MLANKIADEPAFKWWVPQVLRQQHRVIMGVLKPKKKSKYWRTMHKFGIRLPHNVKEALEFDRQMGPNCHFWRDVIAKELSKV